MDVTRRRVVATAASIGSATLLAGCNVLGGNGDGGPGMERARAYVPPRDRVWFSIADAASLHSHRRTLRAEAYRSMIATTATNLPGASIRDATATISTSGNLTVALGSFESVADELSARDWTSGGTVAGLSSYESPDRWRTPTLVATGDHVVVTARMDGERPAAEQIERAVRASDGGEPTASASLDAFDPLVDALGGDYATASVRRTPADDTGIVADGFAFSVGDRETTVRSAVRFESPSAVDAATAESETQSFARERFYGTDDWSFERRGPMLVGTGTLRTVEV